MIEIKDLKKHYGEDGEIKAVDGVSFDCPDGQITGLLGPNGAGKTTTLRMIAALIRPMGGTVIVDGHDVTTDAQMVRSLLGVQSDMLGVYPRLTPREQFRYYGRFYGLKGEALESRVQAVIKELRMEELADRRAQGFSRGERQKIVLGRAFREAVGDARGITRMGHAVVPLDEALVLVAVDFGGRGYAVVDAELTESDMGQLSPQLVHHFLETMAREGGFNLHVRVLSGSSNHHKAEAVFKAIARAVRDALTLDERRMGESPSTKGTIG